MFVLDQSVYLFSTNQFVVCTTTYADALLQELVCFCIASRSIILLLIHAPEFIHP